DRHVPGHVGQKNSHRSGLSSGTKGPVAATEREQAAHTVGCAEKFSGDRSDADAIRIPSLALDLTYPKVENAGVSVFLVNASLFLGCVAPCCILA
ncbi:MAG: hypothetical protein VX791_06845, partial [Pseudomonadota bacterium]|nr:hypothetical protein [Pseudomonadota bacterium]